WRAEGSAQGSAGNNNGTLQGGATFDFGKVGQAFSLNGTSAYVQFNQHVVPTSGSYSVSLFARQNATQNRYIGVSLQGFSGGPGFYIGHDPNGIIRVSDSWLNTGVAFPSDTLWHLYTVTVDATANQTRLYVDGTLRATLNSAISTTAGGTNTRLGRQF